MSRAVFWSAGAVLGYAYAAFPVLMLVRARLAPRPYQTADITPRISLLIAAYNEIDVIAAKLDNVAALDYPREALEVIVASDGSDDGTNEVVGRYAAAGVRLLELPRAGKASAVNAAAEAATGEILVFSDANSMYAVDALRQLVRPFADPTVGGVAGNQVYSSGRGDEERAAGERRYWDIDRLLKTAGSEAGNAIAATGAIYAVRRELFRPVPNGVNDDMFVSQSVIAAGRRLVFAPGAVAVEPVVATNRREFRRKVRVMTRAFRTIVELRELLDVRRHGFYAVQLFSHKVLLRMTVLPLIAFAIASVRNVRRGPVYALAAAGQIGAYGLAVVGTVLERRGHRLAAHPALGLPAYFCLIHAAALAALVNVALGRQVDRWETHRAGANDGNEGATPAPSATSEARAAGQEDAA